MSSILLVGAVLNLAGAVKFLAVERAAGDGDPVLFRWFIAGAATAFGALYLYLYWHTEYVYPFLMFGAALKTWAFTIAAVLYLHKQLSVSWTRSLTSTPLSSLRSTTVPTSTGRAARLDEMIERLPRAGARTCGEGLRTQFVSKYLATQSDSHSPTGNGACAAGASSSDATCNS